MEILSCSNTDLFYNTQQTNLHATDENQQKIKELDAQIATLENKITDLKSAIADYANLSNTLVYDDVAS